MANLKALSNLSSASASNTAMRYYLIILASTVLAIGSLSAETPTAELVENLLSEDLGTRSFSFAEVAEASSGKKVIPFNPENEVHAAIVTALKQSLDGALMKMNGADSPTNDLRRINEASRFFEDALLESLNANGSITCEIPKNRQGKEQRSGYPDLLITHKPSGTKIYLDPKLYEKKSRQSSFRTFYFEPRERTLKITEDAVHLLVGIAHDGDDGNWKFTSWELVDLSHLQVRLKAEFQASNRDLYRPKATLESSPKTEK